MIKGALAAAYLELCRLVLVSGFPVHTQPESSIQDAVVRRAFGVTKPRPICVRTEIGADPDSPCSWLWQSRQYVTVFATPNRPPTTTGMMWWATRADVAMQFLQRHSSRSFVAFATVGLLRLIASCSKVNYTRDGTIICDITNSPVTRGVVRSREPCCRQSCLLFSQCGHVRGSE